jgi:hypothetical protein
MELQGMRMLPLGAMLVCLALFIATGCCIPFSSSASHHMLCPGT